MDVLKRAAVPLLVLSLVACAGPSPSVSDPVRELEGDHVSDKEASSLCRDAYADDGVTLKLVAAEDSTRGKIRAIFAKLSIDSSSDPNLQDSDDDTTLASLCVFAGTLPEKTLGHTRVAFYVLIDHDGGGMIESWTP